MLGYLISKIDMQQKGAHSLYSIFQVTLNFLTQPAQLNQMGGIHESNMKNELAIH